MSSIALITILPIILVVIIILGLGKLLAKFRIWKPKRTFWFANIYFTCGIIAFVALFILSSQYERIAADDELQVYIEENQKLSQDIKYKNVDNLKPEYLQFTKTFEATEENIEIVRADNSYHLRVVVTWNDSDTNDIEASYYQTPIFINRANISKLINPPEIKFEDNNFYIQEVEKEISAKTMHFSLELYDSMTVYEDTYNPFEEIIGLRILHLNVPRHFNIIDNSGWIE
ncbi:glucose-6-phosphate isomerase [Lysinibacillus sp. 2017]|uniref:glucose-6-phosphate isomerase n=1 Tax=unclassified Lysinibacillus TaxID=2636778 RepID=UPI000D526936|nr:MULTISPECIES: glucose-6-phosphate isomerase [unclassified Lysinibacillus]AWE06011.1 glucose-6-phosphate isomerase [Lysinibacillus sp. 2017]TGN34794.1 glucose-6-phosphate isomerase [Lysinibacillus sp. S2017]